MPGKFNVVSFSSCNINDPFFDSLKVDYKEFPEWFARKGALEESAYVFQDENNLILAFMYLKDETEPLALDTGIHPTKHRVKIGTLKLSNSVQGQRLGEGALGIALWQWQQSDNEEIYVTVFDRHQTLIDLLTKFGFSLIGKNDRGESIFLKSKATIDISTPFTAFPYLLPTFEKSGYIPIDDYYHDTLFPFSELQRTNQETAEIAAANGITKIFLAFPSSPLHYQLGEPVIIYRKHTGEGQKTYKSVASSFCTITKVVPVISRTRKQITFDNFLDLAQNKTVFSQEQLQDLYNEKPNISLVEMVYNGFFGKGHNVNHKTLSEAGLFPGYPYNIRLRPEEFLNILQMGDINGTNLIANQS